MMCHLVEDYVHQTLIYEKRGRSTMSQTTVMQLQIENIMIERTVKNYGQYWVGMPLLSNYQHKNRLVKNSWSG